MDLNQTLKDYEKDNGKPKIHVCSSIMGSGKSSGLINALNTSDDDRRYIYITPFLDECTRFVRECDRPFYKPQRLEEFGRSKILHTVQLLKEGKNICTTHSAFKLYTPEILQLISDGSYILLMDESCDVIEEYKCNAADVFLLERAGYIKRYGDVFRYEGPEEYINNSGSLKEICKKATCNNLYAFNSETDGALFYYLTPPEFISSFDKVYIFTYMFNASDLCQMLKIYDMDWDPLYVKLVDYGNGYMITDKEQPTQDYVYEIPDKIHIYEYEDVPPTGRGRPFKDLNHYIDRSSRIPVVKDFRPTLSFYEHKRRNGKLITELRNNIGSFFNRMIKINGGDKSKCIWSVYNDHKDAMCYRGYKDSFVTHNEKATNKYSDCMYIAYMCDLHVSPNKINYFKRHDIEYSNNDYAVSTMTQFIWRSRIRKGQDIWVYLPSVRMRELLYGFIDKLRIGEI